MSKNPATRRETILLDLNPIDEDDAEYVVSLARERCGEEISFEDFLKAHPEDVAKF
jgi:hypothetical protein